MTFEDPVQGRQDRTERGVVELRLGEDRRVPGGEAPAEIRLLGRTVDEALALVDKYLDDVYLAGLSPVRLVHGVGSGRLKRAIADLLGRHPHVEAFASAPTNEGGAGVTVVSLRL